MSYLLVNKALGSTSAQSGGIFLNAGSSIVASGLSGAETAAILIHLNGGSFIAAKDSAGSAVSLTATVSQITIGGAGTYAIGALGTTAADIKIVANQSL